MNSRSRFLLLLAFLPSASFAAVIRVNALANDFDEISQSICSFRENVHSANGKGGGMRIARNGCPRRS